MTDREKVLAKWPEAGPDEMAGRNRGFVILCLGVFGSYSDIDDGVIGWGKTISKAWADAVRRLEPQS